MDHIRFIVPFLGAWGGMGMKSGYWGVSVVSVLVVFCCVILFPSISNSSVPAIVGQDDGGTGNSPVNFNTGEKSRMSQGHQVSVNVTTGNAIVKHTDLVIPTRGKDIVIQRTYNSLEHLNGVEKGLRIYGGTLLSKGIARVNGERVELENDYGLPFSFPDEGTFTFYVYIVSNDSSGTPIVVSRTIQPQSAPPEYYCLGQVEVS